MTIKQIIDYEQTYYSPIRGEGEPPRNYYDPNVMMAEKTYKINPMEEILLVISGSGYRYNDDTIFSLHVNIDQVTTEVIPNVQSSSQLCLLVKNCSSEYSVYVGFKSTLQLLLDTPRIMSRLCFCTVADLTKCRLIYASTCRQNDDTDECYSMFQTAPQETIVIGH